MRKNAKHGWASKLFLSAAICAVLSLVLGTGVAYAGVPGWLVRSYANPANLAPGGNGEIIVDAVNVGGADANAEAAAIELTDKLPPGLTAKAISSEVEGGSVRFSCSAPSASCQANSGVLYPYGEIRVKIAVSVAQDVSSPSSATNIASIGGGGAQPDSNSATVDFNSIPATFGVQQLEQVALNENGTPDTQAGSHPFGYTTTLQLNEGASQLPKELRFNLPPGLVGNPTVVPQCTLEQFSSRFSNGASSVNQCPNDSVVGVAYIWLGNSTGLVAPLFNLTPNVGEPARFGFIVLGVPVFLDTAVRSGGDYGVTVIVHDINTVENFTASQVTFWGAPESPSHDISRGWACVLNGAVNEHEETCQSSPANAAKAPPFLTLPTSCTGPLVSSVEADSWRDQGAFTSAEYSWHDATGPLQLDGCNRLPFSPAITVTPDGQDASTPTGLAVSEHVPQEDTLDPTGLAESDVKSTTVTLPEGVQVSPAGADGLAACSVSQVGFNGPTPQGGLEFSDEEQACPEAAKVATVKIETPLLTHPLVGAAYLAEQDANPFGSLIALYIVVKDPISGVLVKVAGQVTLNPATGQIVSTFQNTPQLPYENLEVHFFGSARAPLTTPPLCGEYTTQGSIEGWAQNPPTQTDSSFQIVAGPTGAPCDSPQPFQPGFEAGSLNLQAGSFTPFDLTMTRPEGDQTLGRVEMQMPPGLLGTLSAVKLCGEPQAALGTCGEESLIGHTIVSAGLGDSPYTVTGGKVYITGPYEGAPFGLSIVNPAVAGPFNLGTVVVRAQIRVNLHTAALTILSDPLPTMLQGIPLQLQHVQVTVERPGGFTFNATNCEPMQITGTLISGEGVGAAVGSRYQVTNCLDLAFQPKLTASTSGHTSRADGASLHVKLTYPAGPYDANIARVKVELPKALPSRLTTLQKACVAKVFEANPANCPAASIVGHAEATTPVLPVPLEGPAYFVSNGNEAFPSLIIVLQGYGVTVDLVGSTFISPKGITSSTFKTVPDVPVGTFELTLPRGPYSALDANTSICKAKSLEMPTEFVGQNGALIKTTTKIQATGCPKVKRVARRKKSGKKHRHRRSSNARRHRGAAGRGAGSKRANSERRH